MDASSLLLYISIKKQIFATLESRETGKNRVSAYENGSITDLAKMSAPKTVLGSARG